MRQYCRTGLREYAVIGQVPCAEANAAHSGIGDSLLKKELLVLDKS
jgi:hypothetical protein